MPDETTMPTEPSVTPTTPPPTAPVAATTPPDQEVEVVKMVRAEYDAWLAERAEAKRLVAEKEQQRIDAEEKAARNAMEKGHFDKAFEKWESLAKEKEARLARERDDAIAAERGKHAAEARRLDGEKAAAENRAKSIESRIKKTTLDRDLAQALAGQNLVPGGAQQLAHLWSSHFTVVEDGEGYASRTGDGKSVAEFVAALLAQPEYAHFIKAGTTRGGTINGPGNPAATATPTATDPAPQPRNMGEALILHMQGLQKAQGDGRANMNLPMGLKAAR